MGERVLSKIQAGIEATKGTAVAADTVLAMVAQQIQPDIKPTYPKENLGVNTDSVRSVIYTKLARYRLTAEHGYYQALPLLFSLGLKGGITPSEQTVDQDDYLWDHTPSFTAPEGNAQQSITLEVGDDVQAFEMEYGMAERIRIRGQIPQDAGDAPVSIETELFARQLTATTFTGSLAIPAMEPMNAKLARFYLDTAWAGVGGTEKTNILRSFDIDILTGVHPKFTGSGSKFFNVAGYGPMLAMASFTFEGNSDADAIWDAFHADPQTFQVARLKIVGSQIGTGATHSLTVDIGGYWEEVIPLGGEDRGNNLHTAVLRSTWNATGSKVFQVAVSTNVAAI